MLVQIQLYFVGLLHLSWSIYRRPMTITQSGKSVYRIESAATAELRDEGIALLKLMNLAERDIKSGRTYSTDEALAMLDEELSSGVASLE